MGTGQEPRTTEEWKAAYFRMMALRAEAEQRGRAAREMAARLVMSQGGSMFLSKLDMITLSTTWEIVTYDEPDGSGMRVSVRDGASPPAEPVNPLPALVADYFAKTKAAVQAGQVPVQRAGSTMLGVPITDEERRAISKDGP